jgi:sialidase-1
MKRKQAAKTGVGGKIVCPLWETGPGNLRNSEGAAVELRDGRILLAYTHFYADADDWGAGDIRGKLSKDGGRTWSKPFLMVANRARWNVGRLALFRMPEVYDGYRKAPGILGMVYTELNQGYQNRLCLITSADEGQNWTHEQPINQTGLVGIVAQRGDTVVVLKSGRILVPVFGVFGGLCASFMYLSDDGGAVWRRNMGEISVKLMAEGRPCGYADFEEPAVAELRDDRLLCFGRTRLGQLYRSFSEDGGVSWGEPEPTGLASSYSPASLKTIPGTGDLLCVWNQVSSQEIADGLGRMRMSCAVSKDDGKTWTHFQNLESLDDTTRIEPEGGASDSVTELNAIKARKALQARDTQTRYPPEVTKRYPRWPGYVHNDYPFVTFTSAGTVLIFYGASDYEMAGLTVGLKLVVRPVDWLYERG